MKANNVICYPRTEGCKLRRSFIGKESSSSMGVNEAETKQVYEGAFHCDIIPDGYQPL